MGSQRYHMLWEGGRGIEYEFDCEGRSCDLGISAEVLIVDSNSFYIEYEGVYKREEN